MREAEVEGYLVEQVKYAGGIAYKFTSPARINVPDRLCVLPGGILFFVELKAPGKLPNDGQKREHHRLRELGVAVYVVDTFDGVDELLEFYAGRRAA